MIGDAHLAMLRSCRGAGPWASQVIIAVGLLVANRFSHNGFSCSETWPSGPARVQVRWSTSAQAWQRVAVWGPSAWPPWWHG